MRTKRYWGPFRQQWFSICSLHHPSHRQENCVLCTTGYWRNVWLVKASQKFYDWNPELWRKWANRGRND